MKRNLQGKIGAVLIATSLFTLFSCKKTFDLQPKSEVSAANMYRNVTDANAAVLGVYGKFLGLAEQYVVLNELRGDLMDVTPNADHWLQEISQHHVTIGNPWADPRPFYSVIMNCNDVLANLNIMLANNRITSADYQYRYSDIGCLRSFLYLQLGIHFGNVPYVTDPITNIDDLKDPSKFPKLAFKDLLTQLINFTNALPWKQPYPTVITLINGSTTISTPTPATIDGFNFNNYFISKYVLLGDLYLWHAAYNPADYTNAATNYRAQLNLPISTPATLTGSNVLAQFWRIPFADVVLHKDFAIGYTRYAEQSFTSFVNSNTLGWRSMFGRSMYPTYDTFLDTEWMWQMNFPQNSLPVDPFLDLFSPQGGRYLVQPSQTAINNWNSQVQGVADNVGAVNATPNFYSDFRGRLTYSDPTNQYTTFNNQNVIMKYLYTYQDPTVLQANKYGRWFLYRAASVNLHFAEAANRDPNRDSYPLASIPGQPTWNSLGRLAYALLNTNGQPGTIGSGIGALFNPYNFTLTPGQGFNPSGPTLPATTAFGAIPNGDATNIEQTFFPAPYNFGARSGATPYFREDWYENVGVRSRANLQPYPLTLMGDQVGLENALVLESGLELAYEGERWPDLLRIALRRGDYTFLSNKVYDKLSKDGYAGAGTAQATLASGQVYLPFNW